jgi:hypothetical protein
VRSQFSHWALGFWYRPVIDYSAIREWAAVPFRPKGQDIVLDEEAENLQTDRERERAGDSQHSEGSAVSGQEEGGGEQRQGAEGKSSPHLNDVSASPSPVSGAASPSSASSDSDQPLHGRSNSHGNIGDAITPVSGGASSSSKLADSAGPSTSSGSSTGIESESWSEGENGFCGYSALESSLSAAVAEAERRERAVDLVPTSPRFSRAVTIQMVRDIQSDASSAFAAAAQPISPAVASNEGGIEVLMHRHSNKALMSSMITGQVAPLMGTFGAQAEAQAPSLSVGALPSLIGSLSGRGALSTDSLDDAGEQDSDLNEGEEGETNTGTGSGSGGGCEETSKFLPLPSLPLPLLLPSLLDCMEDISYLETLALDALREAASYNHSHQARDSSSGLYAGQHQQQYSGGYFI